jgi:hypothetical protein
LILPVRSISTALKIIDRSNASTSGLMSWASISAASQSTRSGAFS